MPTGKHWIPRSQRQLTKAKYDSDDSVQGRCRSTSVNGFLNFYFPPDLRGAYFGWNCDCQCFGFVHRRLVDLMTKCEFLRSCV